MDWLYENGPVDGKILVQPSQEGTGGWIIVARWEQGAPQVASRRRHRSLALSYSASSPRTTFPKQPLGNGEGRRLVAAEGGAGAGGTSGYLCCPPASTARAVLVGRLEVGRWCALAVLGPPACCRPQSRAPAPGNNLLGSWFPALSDRVRAEEGRAGGGR